MTQLAHTIAEAGVLARAGRTAIYDAINDGSLIAHKRGRRTLIFAADLQRWVDSLPKLVAKNPIKRAVSGTPQATTRSPAERRKETT